MVKRSVLMDQIVKALSLINSFRIEGLHGEANPTSGARLNLTGGLEELKLTAADGNDLGITMSSQGFGIGNLSLPSSQDPSIALDPYLSHLNIDLHKELFARLAKFAGEALLADMHTVINRVVVRRLHTVVRLTAQKVLHADLILDHVHLQQGSEEMIRLKNISLSLLDYDTKLPPAKAKKSCKVVLRSMQVEIEQAFFDRLLGAAKSKIPKEVSNVSIELPGPHMIVGAHAKKGIFGSNFRVDLQLETESDLFGIHIKRLYVPGTNRKVPDFIRDWILSLVRIGAEKKLRGLAEVSNESVRINPWPKVPVELITHVTEFAVKDGKILVSFAEPTDRRVPERAADHAIAAARSPQPGDIQQILAPGPAL